MTRQFSRPPYPELYDQEIKLHVGCGSIDYPGFINIDGMPLSNVHYVRNIDNLSPFEDDTVSLIYASHCLEHFSHNRVPDVLNNWFEKLRPGGILRLAVPDFDQLVSIYLEYDKDVNKILYPMMGSQSDHLDFHKIAFNHKNLKALLLDTGFSEVREWFPELQKQSGLSDWSNRSFMINGKNHPISLNLEAIK